MEICASLKNARISEQKVRLIASKIRGLKVVKALDFLNFSPKKASFILKKLLESAISNAEHNNGMDIDNLKISGLFVDQGSKLKRFRARAKGRLNYIFKRNCHIVIKVKNK